jgi:outer membrane immunogenic protein
MASREFLKITLASLAAAVGLLAAAPAALSADLPMRSPPIFSPTPVYNWAGFYVGVNGGYGWGNQDPLGLITNKFDSASFSTSGGIFGGTVGAQMQQGHVVLGVEGDLDWAGISGSKSLTPTIGGVAQPFSVNLKAEDDWVATGRLRIGYAQDNWLFFATTGLAMLGAQPHLTVVGGQSCATLAIPNCSQNPIKGGLAVGAGVEYGFSQNWSAKLEYLWIGQLQGVSLQNANLIRVGLNYRFGG